MKKSTTKINKTAKPIKISGWNSLLKFLNNFVVSINTSRVFAGIMIIILNVSSKFITMHFSKSMESFLKYTFSRNILIFAICYMGSRDIYISLGLTLFFILLMDVLLNEESGFCILPESFTQYHTTLMENMENQNKDSVPTQGEINKAIKVLSELSKNKVDKISTTKDKNNIVI
jgi:uncharacterized membrane protein